MNDTTLSLGNTEEVEKPVSERLQECAAACLTSLGEWNGNHKDTDAREKLMESVHELRKVASRIEIDIAMAERVNTNAKRIPIPEHKSKMEKKTDQKPLSEILPVAEIKQAVSKKKIDIQNAEESHDEIDDGAGDGMPNSNEQSTKKKRRPRRKKMDNTNQTD